jgi:hypothetical protein
MRNMWRPRLAASHNDNGSMMIFSPQRGFAPFCSRQSLGMTGSDYSSEIV